MKRPIEESIYDATLTKDEKLDLLLRHYNRQGMRVTQPDDLMDAVMTEGVSHMEAARYWASSGGSHKWALYHAEEALRADPGSMEALVMWAKELPANRRTEREAAYLAVLERNPTHRQALANLATAATMERPRESMEYAKRYIEAYPNRGGGYAYMGRAHERLGDRDTARSYYEEGLKVSPRHASLHIAIEYLDNGGGIEPIEAAQPTTAAPEPPAASSTPPTTGPAEEPSPRVPASAPEPPAPPTPPRETLEPVEPYRAALEEYRAMADEFESITGESYQGLQDFDDYAKQSSNWMAWRYIELGQQYLDAGKPDEAAEVFEKAERQFPDDPLIPRRTQQRR